MKPTQLVAAAIGALVLTTAGARAADLRYPRVSSPAFVIHVPDDWAHHYDSDGNMLITTADRSAAFSLSVVEGDGDLDAIAAQAMHEAKADAPQRKGSVTISGFSGYEFDTAMANDGGTHMSVKMLLVRISSRIVASCSLLEIDGISPSDHALAQAALDSVTITTAQY
ncbi:MAG: hypothetical protein ABSD74_10095 [Rhizomicrobium sp.]